MKKIYVITAVVAVVATVAILIIRAFSNAGDVKLEAMEMKLTGIKSGIAVECGGEISDVHLSLPLSVKSKDVISVSSDTDIAYLKLTEKSLGKRVFEVDVVAVSEGIAEVYFRSSDGNYETEKFKINVIGGNVTVTAGETVETTEEITIDGTAVYVTPSGTKYHLKKSCAGEKAVVKELTDAVNEGYLPCKSCAMSD